MYLRAMLTACVASRLSPIASAYLRRGNQKRGCLKSAFFFSISQFHFRVGKPLIQNDTEYLIIVDSRKKKESGRNLELVLFSFCFHVVDFCCCGEECVSRRVQTGLTGVLNDTNDESDTNDLHSDIHWNAEERACHWDK